MHVYGTRLLKTPTPREGHVTALSPAATQRRSASYTEPRLIKLKQEQTPGQAAIKTYGNCATGTGPLIIHPWTGQSAAGGCSPPSGKRAAGGGTAARPGTERPERS